MLLPIELYIYIIDLIDDLDTLYNTLLCFPILYDKYKEVFELKSYVREFIHKAHNVHNNDPEKLASYADVLCFPSNNLIIKLRETNYVIDMDDIKEEIKTNKDFCLITYETIVVNNDDYKDFCLALSEIWTEDPIIESYYSIDEEIGYILIYKKESEIVVPIDLLKFYKKYNITPKYLGMLLFGSPQYRNECIEFQDYLPLYSWIYCRHKHIIGVNCNPNSHQYGYIGLIRYDEEQTETYVFSISINVFMEKIENIEVLHTSGLEDILGE